MENMRDAEKLVELFDRTLRNCLYCEKAEKKMSLLNEIGCLRGIAYCLEEFGVCVHQNNDFLRMIQIQQDMNGSELL